MYARTTLIDIAASRVNELVTIVEGGLRGLAVSLPGSLGLSLLCDRASGRCVVTTAWDTERAMRDSFVPLTTASDEIGRRLGGTPVPEEWEVADLHRLRRSGPGFWSRSTRVEFEPLDAEAVLQIYRSTTVPELELLTGFCSATLLLDCARGRGVSTVTYDSYAALAGSRHRAGEIRRTSTEKAHARVGEVMELEVAVAAITVPGEARWPGRWPGRWPARTAARSPARLSAR